MVWTLPMVWTLLHVAVLALGGGLVVCAFVYGLATGQRTPRPAPTRGGHAFATLGFYLLNAGLLIAVQTRAISFLPLALLAHVVASVFVVAYLLAHARWALALGIGWGCIYFGGMFPVPAIQRVADIAALGFFGAFLVLLCWLTMRETPTASLSPQRLPEPGS